MSETPRHTTQEQAYALAGVAQFVLYAHEIAADGRDINARFERAKHAVLCTDPQDVMDVYGDASQLADGLRYLRVQLAGERPDAKAAAVARYIGQMLKISGRIMRDDQALGQIRGAIDRARLADTQHVADIADILDTAYRETVSHVRPRIMLQGHPSYLQNPRLQARIRTHLLAAVRCGVMWRQCGGGFLTLFFRRKALLATLG